MNTIYRNIGNTYEIKDDVVHMVVLKKNGTELITKIDVSDLDSISNMGTWFAEWNKDYNSYIVQSISSTNKNKKSKPLKQSLQSVILNVNTKAPIKHINGDTLDNRRCNLEIVERNTKNEYEVQENGTVAIILKDKLGKKEGVALISEEDLNDVINNNYSWVLHKSRGKNSVVANTPNGRFYLHDLLMNPTENEKVIHVNHNTLDNRRNNLKNETIEE